MAEPRNYSTEAIVIKKTKLGEADSILTFFTPELGKIQGFGKSLRKTKSKMAGHLELLTYSKVTFARGKNIDTITGAQTIEGFLPIRSDLWLTSCGLYIAELVGHFTPEHQENLSLFQTTLETLRRLCETENRELALRFFEMRLLDAAGYRPQIRECVSCHRTLEPETNCFSPSSGGMLCPECSRTHLPVTPVSLNAQKVMRLLQSRDFADAERLKLSAGLAHELETVIGAYLRYLLERDVKSAAWLDNLREQFSRFQPPDTP